MAMLQKMWDDVVAGPQPEKGLGKLRKITTSTITSSSSSSPSESSFKGTDHAEAGGSFSEGEKSPLGGRRENVWWTTFHPGSNPATRDVGAELFDKAPPTSPTVYDWLYSCDTKTTHR